MNIQIEKKSIAQQCTVKKLGSQLNKKKKNDNRLSNNFPINLYKLVVL